LPSPELKLSLVRAYLGGEGSLNALSKEHDISHSLLRYWVGRYRNGNLQEEERWVDRESKAQARIRTLERKVLKLEFELVTLRLASVASDPALAPARSRLA
jgi:transposase-like protein